MELIKQIKDAEHQAAQMVEKARLDAATLLDAAKSKRAELLRQAQQQRLARLDQAVQDAEKTARTEVEQLAAKGTDAIGALKETAAQRFQTCVDKVLSQLQQT